jgi:hypothetical protein
MMLTKCRQNDERERAGSVGFEVIVKRVSRLFGKNA